MELLIRKMKEDDLDSLYGLLADPAVMRYLEEPYTREKTAAFLKTAGLSEPPLVCAAEKDGEFIGYVIFHDYDAVSVEIGWVLRPDVWGKGYASALTEQMIGMARASGKETVIECDPGQEVSRHIAEKFRFDYEGRRDGLDVFRLGTRCPERSERMKQVFESDRIRFVEVSELLVPDYLVMVNDDEHVNRYIGGYIGGSREPYTEAQEIEWVRKTLEDKALVYSMIEKESGGFIGNIELMEPADGAAELGIAITGKQQDRGFGTEAVRALTAYGMHQLGLRRIFLRTNPSNARAIRVYQKCGFREYRRTEEHVYMEYFG